MPHLLKEGALLDNRHATVFHTRNGTVCCRVFGHLNTELRTTILSDLIAIHGLNGVVHCYFILCATIVKFHSCFLRTLSEWC